MYSEVRIAVCGNVDVGKSTLLGVLSRGTLDNGRGRARLNIFKHKHEIETGRTSDIGREILGFNNDGDIVNYTSGRAPTWSEICEKSSKVVMFMDLAGHEKYLKTTGSSFSLLFLFLFKFSNSIILIKTNSVWIDW